MIKTGVGVNCNKNICNRLAKENFALFEEKSVL